MDKIAGDLEKAGLLNSKEEQERKRKSRQCNCCLAASFVVLLVFLIAMTASYTGKGKGSKSDSHSTPAPAPKPPAKSPQPSPVAPTPSPGPSPVPSLAPSPLPSPLPSPVASPLPSPEPSPSPSPSPLPSPPLPSPSPSPIPSPSPSPIPSPSPSPAAPVISYTDSCPSYINKANVLACMVANDLNVSSTSVGTTTASYLYVLAKGPAWQYGDQECTQVLTDPANPNIALAHASFHSRAAWNAVILNSNFTAAARAAAGTPYAVIWVALSSTNTTTGQSPAALTWYWDDSSIVNWGAAPTPGNSVMWKRVPASGMMSPVTVFNSTTLATAAGWYVLDDADTTRTEGYPYMCRVSLPVSA